MISSVNGEVCFTDGLCIGALMRCLEISKYAVRWVDLEVPKWKLMPLGIHPSIPGDFNVQAVVNEAGRVEAVYLCHSHLFYEAATPLDGERRVYHEGVIALELKGQREFPWGNVFCRFNPHLRRDWLVVVYHPSLNVPLHNAVAERMLIEHELPPPGKAPPPEKVRPVR